MFAPPVWMLVIFTALVDSINPLSVGIFITVLIYLLGHGHKNKNILLLASTYIFTVFISYLLLGYLTSFIVDSIPARLFGYVALTLAALVAFAGALEIKDYFWYGKGISLRAPSRIVSRLHGKLAARGGVGKMFVVGTLVSFTSIPISGMPLLALVAIVRPGVSLGAVLLTALFALIFVLPLIAITILTIKGVKISHIARWKDHTKTDVRLFTGLMLVFLSWLLILTANSTINLM